MNDFVYKPFEEDVLLQKVIKWLEIDAVISVATKK